MENCRLEWVENGAAGIADGTEIPTDLAVIATGTRPQKLFRDSGLPVADDGGLIVNNRLQCPSHPEIFGGGDCVSPEHGRYPRIGVVACRQNPVISRNVLSVLEQRKMSVFRIRRSYLQIFNLGNSRALMVKGGAWLSGRSAFWLKHRIDTRFIRRLRRSVKV